LIEVLYLLLNNKPLPPKYKDHDLIGNYKGFRECHIKPDLLLIHQKMMNICHWQGWAVMANYFKD
jgi:addiction module toxin, relE/stbE family